MPKRNIKDLGRLLELAGLEENADYDYGANQTSRKGEPYDFDHFVFQGRANLPDRIVNHYGDNPLKQPNSTEVVLEKSFRDYLKETEVSELDESEFFQLVRSFRSSGCDQDEAERRANKELKNRRKSSLKPKTNG